MIQATMFGRGKEQAPRVDNDWQIDTLRRIERLESRIDKKVRDGLHRLDDSPYTDESHAALYPDSPRFYHKSPWFTNLFDSRESGKTGFIEEPRRMSYQADQNDEKTFIYFDGSGTNPFLKIVKVSYLEGYIAVAGHIDPQVEEVFDRLPEELKRDVLSVYLTDRNGDTSKVVSVPRALVGYVTLPLNPRTDMEPPISDDRFSLFNSFHILHRDNIFNFREVPFVPEQDVPIMKAAYQTLEARLQKPLVDNRSTLRRNLSAVVHRLPQVA